MEQSNDQYLTFFIRGEEYAVSILRVKEIIEYESITRVPTTPAHVRGVLNLRGTVLPVIDLAAKFGHGDSEATRTTCVIVAETKHLGQAPSPDRTGEGACPTLVVGLLADAVSSVVDIPADAVEPPPSFGTNIRVDFLTGMGKLEGRLVLILDLDRILSPLELEQLAS